MTVLLDVQGLQTQFATEQGVVHAVNGISYQLNERETLGIVGESGSGKTAGMLSLMRLIPQPPGRIGGRRVIFQGEDLLRMSEDDLRALRGNRIAMIFQDPMTSLNPVLTVGHQITEVLELHLGLGRADARRRAIELLDLVGIPSAAGRIDDYPHQFSGGMRQRVLIAMALSCEPQLLIADEPTTALDVTIQAQVIELVKELRDEIGMAILWITHDLGVIAGLADRVMVMYAGFIVEEAAVDGLYDTPLHPYTRALLSSVPRLDDPSDQRLTAIPGMPPNLTSLPPGCPFHDRCTSQVERCTEERPALEQVEIGHRVACWVESGSNHSGSAREDRTVPVELKA